MLNEVYDDLKDRMEKTIVNLERDLKKVRTGRATPALLDGLKADYYGTPTPIAQMGSITAPEARLLMIQPWDVQALPELEKAILKSELGLTPQNDGKIIRINIPPPSQERRRELSRLVKKMAEEGKVAVRNLRREANEMLKSLKKDKSISEDEQTKAEAQVQKVTDEYVKKIDDICAAKEKEIMEF